MLSREMDTHGQTEGAKGLLFRVFKKKCMLSLCCTYAPPCVLLCFYFFFCITSSNAVEK